MSLEGPKTHGSAYPDPVPEIMDFIKNRSVFKLFSKPKKSEKRLPRHPTNTKKQACNSLKTISMKNRVLQYFPCENNDFEVPDVENSSQKAINK